MWTFEITSDKYDIEDAFNWYQETPGFLKSFVEPFAKNEIEEFVDELQKGYNFSGFENGKLTAIVHASIVNEQTVEGHLFCNTNAEIEFLISLVNFAKVKCLKDHDFVICHILKKHKLLHTIMQRAGFAPTGLRGWQHIYRGQLMEVVYYYTMK